MTDIVIQGIGGRMGHVLCDMIAQREDCCVVAGIDMKDGEQNGIPVYDSLEKLNGKGDVIIDFSSPAAVEKALPYCQTHKMPIVVCTTGLSEELQLKVVQLSRSVPVFKSANMSMGINVLSELCKRASAILGAAYDVEIVEQHHHNKLDAPSGTALMLADAINEENDGAYHYVYDRSSVRRKRDPKEIGSQVIVQGGTFMSDATLRAFEQLTGVHAVRPDIAGCMGAYGAALLARDRAGADDRHRPSGDLLIRVIVFPDRRFLIQGRRSQLPRSR